MGFFNDLKEDLASAVNELTDEKAEREIALSGEHLREDIARFDNEKQNKKKKEKSPNENLEREIQNILNGIDEKNENQNTISIDIREVTVEEEAPKDSNNTEVSEEENIESEQIEAESDVNEEVAEEEIESETEEDLSSYNSENFDNLTVICKGTTVKGSIYAEGSVQVEGTVEGDITAAGELIISGNVTGNIEGLVISVNRSTVRGNIKSFNGLFISEESVVIGDIESTDADIAGAVKGKIDVNGPVTLRSEAKVLGDIDCKSVQINNGAVIEGKCSQKYSEVSPSAFFENFN